MCEEYNDIFSKDSSDIGKTPLITMEIETGDSPPVCQKPHNLPLKHIDWVQKELNTLEKAGVITRSVFTMGQSHCDCTLENGSRRASQEKTLCGLQSHQ